MPRDWEAKISDLKERKVFEALSDPEWDFRTVPGISKTTGLEASEVEAILNKHLDLIRILPIPDNRGRQLYTLRSRPISVRERLAVTQRAASKSL